MAVSKADWKEFYDGWVREGGPSVCCHMIPDTLQLLKTVASPEEYEKTLQISNTLPATVDRAIETVSAYPIFDRLVLTGAQRKFAAESVIDQSDRIPDIIRTLKNKLASLKPQLQDLTDEMAQMTREQFDQGEYQGRLNAVIEEANSFEKFNIENCDEALEGLATLRHIAMYKRQR